MVISQYLLASELVKPCTCCILMGKKNVSAPRACSGLVALATTCTSRDTDPWKKTLLHSSLTRYSSVSVLLTSSRSNYSQAWRHHCSLNVCFWKLQRAHYFEMEIERRRSGFDDCHFPRRCCLIIVQKSSDSNVSWAIKNKLFLCSLNMTPDHIFVFISKYLGKNTNLNSLHKPVMI